MFNIFKLKPTPNETKEELSSIITCKEVYDKDSLDGANCLLPLYYLKLQNSEGRVFNSRICLCKSELTALKTTYQLKYNSYSTKKVYSLELSPDKTIILDEIETTLKEVWEDEKLKSNFNSRLSEGITPYTKKDLKKIDDKCELIWDMYSREPMCVVKRGDKFILPKDALDKKARMPFGLSGGSREMIDKNGKYGIINTGNSLKNDLNYKLLYPFDYHYIRLDGFGNAELLKEKIDHGGDYKKLVCTMVNLWDKNIEPKQVLLNSTTNDEYITIDSDGLLTQHTKNGSSKPYQTIIQSFLKPKPVRDSSGLWGYIDKDAKEIIPCKFEDWNFFNDGYALLKVDDKPFLIDETGEIVVEPFYEEIEHYKNDIFFVKTENKWGAIKDKNLYVDFIDVDKEVALVQKTNNLADEEIMDFMLRETAMAMRILPKNYEPYYLLLSLEIFKKKQALHPQMYQLPLKEYMALFDIPQSKDDLVEMGLWGKVVRVKECEITDRYKELLKDATSGTIGYHHQMGGSCYAMDIELPVDFEKLDGSSVSLGIGFGDLEIV